MSIIILESVYLNKSNIICFNFNCRFNSEIIFVKYKIGTLDKYSLLYFMGKNGCN